MSIPPLVCSTPPPPDQCEDDKDHEDFDLSYSLSQEDDDDENNSYNYGNFSSTYNTFQTAPDSKPHEIQEQETAENIENKHTKEESLQNEIVQQSQSNIVVHNLFGTNDINENKLKCDEDLNIEDLNLKLDEEIEIINASNNEQIETSESHDVKAFDIPNSLDNDSPSCDNINLPSLDDNVRDVTDSLKDLNIAESFQEALAVDVDETHYVSHDSVIGGPQESNENYKFEETVRSSETKLHTNDPLHNHSETKSEEQNTDDDFGDFDDFQSVNAKSNVASIVEKSDNPWGSDNSNDFEFGNFTANFEENKPSTVESIVVKDVPVSGNTEQINSEFKEIDNQSEDDDFGDFDDFKSSSVKTETNELTGEEASDCHDFPVFNLQSTDSEHQVLESITKVLSTVFLEEISEPETDYEGNLETLLSETWGHLMETDERQPYIVNWNNSLGQKTLLRALCIDSRNILFGPKWSSNMPKYAANLSNAPLQPHKQISVPTTFVTPNEVVTEKPSSKPTTWNDPFTTDGRESCNTENESATITPGPTDLDVFEAAATTKLDKIYSNTIGVQPLRQISLPDTHIFTPTDSEIPRSKTIHYDRPTVLIPQSSDSQNQLEKNIPNNDSPLESSKDDNDYWEFQNFKSTSETSSVPSSVNSQITPPENNLETAKTVNALPKPNVAYQTELLQPIRVEHTIPTLNWPEPGEVRQTYDDFSDFVSISSQPSETRDRSSSWSADFRQDSANKNELGSFSGDAKPGVSNPVSSIVDDDFDTFQSAQPSNITSQSFKTSFQGSPITQIPSSRNILYDNPSSKLDSIKSDAISFESLARPNKALTHNVGFKSNQSELTNKSPLSSNTPIQTNILQPSPAGFSNIQSQSKSTQILQPLSLESYSQINWPSPGIDLQDLSRFNPVETVHTLKSDLSVGSSNKTASPSHSVKSMNSNQAQDDDMWGEFVSSKPKQQQSQPKKPSVFVDDDEWTDFISSPTVKPINGLNTISLNVHTNSSIQKSVQNKYGKKSNQPPLDIPTLNYITPKANTHMSYNDKHFQNL